MQNARLLSFGLVASAVIILVSNWPVQAAPADEPPTAFLERSEIIGIGKKVHITRVPVTNADGRVRYYDLEIELNVTNKGVGNKATVISERSPKFLTNEFIAGNYEEFEGAQCVLTSGVALGAEPLWRLIV